MYGSSALPSPCSNCLQMSWGGGGGGGRLIIQYPVRKFLCNPGGGEISTCGIDLHSHPGADPGNLKGGLFHRCSHTHFFRPSPVLGHAHCKAAHWFPLQIPGDTV